jgi:hypothetical protein
MGPKQSDHNKRLITFTVITLSNFVQLLLLGGPSFRKFLQLYMKSVESGSTARNATAQISIARHFF